MEQLEIHHFHWLPSGWGFSLLFFFKIPFIISAFFYQLPVTSDYIIEKVTGYINCFLKGQKHSMDDGVAPYTGDLVTIFFPIAVFD